jgi:hypothetical protein
MKNITLCLLSVFVMLISVMPAHAGFMVNKTVATQTAQAKSAAESTTADASVTAALEQFNSPSSVFVRWAQNGTLGTFTLLFGILSFFAPLFSIAAILFGFIGMKRFCSNRGMAIIGFVLGITALMITVLSGFAPLPIF